MIKPTMISAESIFPPEIRSIINNTIGKLTAAVIDETETIPVENSTIAKIIRQIGKATGYKPMIIPAPVATPFPPLNPAKIVYACPRIAQRPARIIMSVSLSNGNPSIRIFDMTTVAATPLAMSNTATKRPAFHPRTRKALVPPALPDPNCRMSIPFSSFPTIILVGIEPTM